MPLFAPWKRYQFFMRLKKKKKKKKRKRRRRVQTQNGNAWSFARHFWVTIAYDRSFRGGHSSSRHFSCPTCLRASHSQILPLLSLSLFLPVYHFLFRLVHAYSKWNETNYSSCRGHVLLSSTLRRYRRRRRRRLRRRCRRRRRRRRFRHHRRRPRRHVSPEFSPFLLFTPVPFSFSV